MSRTSISRFSCAACGLGVVAAWLWATMPAGTSPGQNPIGASAADRIRPTAHPAISSELSDLWLEPPQTTRSLAATPPLADFARGVRLFEETGNAEAALPLVSAGALARTPMAHYARYYTGLVQQQLGRLDEADAAFAAVAAADIEGHLPEDAALARAEMLEARRDFAGAVAIYETLVLRRLAAPSLVLLRLAGAAEAAGAGTRALAAYRGIHFEHPLSAEAPEAEAALERLNQIAPDTPELLDRERARADLLFTSRRWSAAQKGYERVRARADGAGRQHATIRISACDVQLGRHRQGWMALEPYLRQAGEHALEARFYALIAARGLGRHAEYQRMVHDLARDFPGTPLAAQALDELATHHIRTSDDRAAEAIFRRVIDEFPSGRFTDRAAWRAGWWAYRRGEFADSIRMFEHGLAAFPRADYRPAWLYWSARAYERMGNRAAAIERYRLTATDYRNIYHGRLAWRRLDALGDRSVPLAVQRRPPGAEGALPPTSDTIGLLISLGLHREALRELQYAQRVWGDSPQLAATVALVHNRMGNLRLGINTMRRAYPQFMAAGGEHLPDEVLRVLFPIDYWPLLQKHAAARGLDPYLVAALVAQESTFDPVIRSSANAIGLMQIIPATGRRYAQRLHIAPFSEARLTNPEVNVRIGTTYFADLMQRFGAAHLALASYNAGEARVARWRLDRPGLDQDEFIDDIPFPETQNYVRRILGTVEDYRRLYGRTGS